MRGRNNHQRFQVGLDGLALQRTRREGRAPGTALAPLKLARPARLRCFQLRAGSGDRSERADLDPKRMSPMRATRLRQRVLRTLVVRAAACASRSKRLASFNSRSTFLLSDCASLRSCGDTPRRLITATMAACRSLAAFQLQADPDGPDFLRLQRRLLARKTPLVPGIAVSSHVNPFEKDSRCAPRKGCSTADISTYGRLEALICPRISPPGDRSVCTFT